MHIPDSYLSRQSYVPTLNDEVLRRLLIKAEVQ